MKSQRAIMTFINYTFVLILAAFTLAICLLLSAAFTEEECIEWAIEVLQSVAMGTFVTEPAIDGSMLLAKLFGCWILLRLDRKRREKIARAEYDLQKIIENVQIKGAGSDDQLKKLDQAIENAKSVGATGTKLRSALKLRRIVRQEAASEFAVTKMGDMVTLESSIERAVMPAQWMNGVTELGGVSFDSKFHA